MGSVIFDIFITCFVALVIAVFVSLVGLYLICYCINHFLDK